MAVGDIHGYLSAEISDVRCCPPLQVTTRRIATDKSPQKLHIQALWTSGTIWTHMPANPLAIFISFCPSRQVNISNHYRLFSNNQFSRRTNLTTSSGASVAFSRKSLEKSLNKFFKKTQIKKHKKVSWSQTKWKRKKNQKLVCRLFKILFRIENLNFHQVLREGERTCLKLLECIRQSASPVCTDSKVSQMYQQNKFKLDIVRQKTLQRERESVQAKKKSEFKSYLNTRTNFFLYL